MHSPATWSASLPRPKFPLVSLRRFREQSLLTFSVRQDTRGRSTPDGMATVLAAPEQSSAVNSAMGVSSSRPIDPAAEPSSLCSSHFREYGQLLESFSTNFVPLFPFVVIPSNTAPDAFTKEKPFLSLAVAMIAHKSGMRQRELARAAQKYIADHIVMSGERDLDLLQGLLVLTAWYVDRVSDFGFRIDIFRHHLVILPDSIRTDVLIHLTLGQLTSLGLNEPVNSGSIRSFWRELNIISTRTTRTLEERRAYLGCYYATSMYVSTFASPVRTVKLTIIQDIDLYPRHRAGSLKQLYRRVLPDLGRNM